MRRIKPYIKGILLVIIGIINTIRIEIGIGRIWINIIFGPITYLFLCFSGLIIKELILVKKTPSYNSIINNRYLILLFGVIWGTGIGLATFHVFIYNLNIFVLILAILIGIIWLGLWQFTVLYNKSNIIIKIIENLCYTLGIIYGAILNTLNIPIFIYFFFITIFSSQLSRDFLRKIKKIKEDNGIIKKSKKINHKREKIGFNELENEFGTIKILKLSLIFQIISIAFFILPIFTDLYSISFYLYQMIIGLVLLGSSSILTLKGIIEKRNKKIIGLLIKVGIIFELIAFSLANF